MTKNFWKKTKNIGVQILIAPIVISFWVYYKIKGPGSLGGG